MEILPPLHLTLNLVAFISNLIDLQQFNTIIVLHDQANRNQISFMIETLTPRYDVAWMLVNEFDNTQYLKHSKIQQDKTLVLTALQEDIIFMRLLYIYGPSHLDKRSKNLIVSKDILKPPIKTSLLRLRINTVFVDWSRDEIMINAWNPTSVEKYIELNETEFLSARYPDSNRKYSGVFFHQLQSMRGKKTVCSVSYHVKNVYNVTSKDSVASIDGAVIPLLDIIGEAIQSPIEYWVMKHSAFEYYSKTTRLSLAFFERSYRTSLPIQLRNFYTFGGMVGGNMKRFMYAKSQSENEISIGMFDISMTDTYMTYPYGFDNYVIVVENNTTTTATTIQRIFTSPVIYLWMLLIFIFVVVRCGIQWLIESNATNMATKRRKCVLMCEDTVQLSCGVVINEKLFASRRYGYTMLAHGATIIPLVAGIFISGLLYGDFLIHSQMPNIDSIEQLERSNLPIYSDFYDNNTRVKNAIVKTTNIDVLYMIRSGNTSCAYIVPESWTGFLYSDNFKRNGRPLFHVVKERFGVVPMAVQTGTWILYNRMSTIVKRLQEHGFMIHFDSVAEQTTKPTATEMQSNALDESNVVAEAGGLQEIQIVCYIYLVGMACGIVTFISEYLSKRISQ